MQLGRKRKIFQKCRKSLDTKIPLFYLFGKTTSLIKVAVVTVVAVAAVSVVVVVDAVAVDAVAVEAVAAAAVVDVVAVKTWSE